MAVLILHLIVNAATPYGFHRDEFLYLAMGRHLQLFSMDFPPFIAIAAKATLATLGGSLLAVRFLPAVAGALVVLMAALLARRFGGGRQAQVTAALAVALSPVFLRTGNLLQPVIFDALWWTLALYLLSRLAESGSDPRRDWLLLGAVLGIGLLTKFSIAFIGIGLVVAILVTPLRRSLLTPWPWAALGIALLIGSPSLIGQVRLGFPVTAQMADLQASQLERVSPMVFLAGQVHMFQPLLLLVLKGKAYYVAPVYPALFAAGAVWLERKAVPWRVAALAIIVVFGAIGLPFGVPILGPERMARYAAAIGESPETNTGESIALPQDYADMLGWEDQVRATAEVYRSLSPADRDAAVILGTNYGRAGAHDHLGPALGLPGAVSPIGSYWYFGPGKKPGNVVVVIGGDREEIAPMFESVELAGRVTGEWRVPEERDVPIWVARSPKVTLQQVWPRFEGEH